MTGPAAPIDRWDRAGRTDSALPALTRREVLASLLAAAAAHAGPGVAIAQQAGPGAGAPVTLDLLLAIVGLVQPASTADVARFWANIAGLDPSDQYPEAALAPVLGPVESQLFGALDDGLLVAVQSKPEQRFSLSRAGEQALSPDLRRTRDVLRFFLLRGPRTGIVTESRGRSGTGVGGDSPSQLLRSSMNFASTTMTGRKAQLWSSLVAVFETGRPVVFPRDTILPYFSFDNLDQLRAAGGVDADGRITAAGFALCLGVSLERLAAMAAARDRHYRTFWLEKRRFRKQAGPPGRRRIESPRVFMKLVQRFVLDFFLIRMRVHPAVHSFERGRSPITNSRGHIGRNFVASMDIADYFGSIRAARVREMLPSEVFSADALELITQLCAKGEAGAERLPQGAPTSPKLSNLFLSGFDADFAGFCAARGVTYTRYADDLCLSGERYGSVNHAIHVGRQWLRAMGLQINGNKLRFNGRNDRQMITGLVVNERGWPPRRLRRQIRAMFHNAGREAEMSAADIARLRGYLSYLSAFRGLDEHPYPADELDRYRQILSRLGPDPKAR